MHILVIEDEVQLARYIARAISRTEHEALVAHDGLSGLAMAREHSPDLIVLDLNLPGLDGLGVLAHLKEEGCPARVLILTARDDVASKVKGLRAGADDYLAKPFAMEEMLMRIHALGRRGPMAQAARWLEAHDLRMDVKERRVTRAGQALMLSPREFDVLRVFLEEPGRVFSRTELCERVWQREHEYDMRTVDIVIARLRKKLDAGFAAPLIHTSRARGYGISVDEASSGTLLPARCV